ncbi:MAG: hypothetical protein JKY54_16510 [Flavobacteriales bacterium]|nr:hypothetical protein [Flavobacteriales bacterium]
MLSLLLVGNGHAQLNVMSSSFSAYNVTPNSISQVSISSSNSGMVYIESQLTNSANEVVLRVKSEPVQIVIGLNVFGAHNTQFQSTAFSNSPQAKFIQTQHRLPSGVFNHCIRIIPISGIEDGDEYCNQINAEEDGFLYLINPMDQDTIDTFNPLLLWAHSEPFNLLNQGEFFKMTLVELQIDQSAQDGIIKNQPVFLKTYLSRHEVPYPFDAKKLMPGKRYGWQVQKISNGAIINQTEAWEFVLVENEIPEDHMYVKLLKKLDGGHYKVQNDRIFFRFDERYKSDHLVCRIYTDASVLIEPELLNKQKQEIGAKVTGYNNYELDVQPYHLKTGFYLLEVENEKGDKYLLKFYVG